jgi:hypothetical protein
MFKPFLLLQEIHNQFFKGYTKLPAKIALSQLGLIVVTSFSSHQRFPEETLMNKE